MPKPLVIAPEILSQIRTEALNRYPNEACGLLVGWVGHERVAVDFFPCENIQNELHEKDPMRYSRDALTAYVIDARDFEDVEKMAKEKGLSIVAVVHSHPNSSVYFSKEDKDNAAPWGEPLFQNLSYVILSVTSSGVAAMSDFYWDEAQKDFLEIMVF